MLQKHAPILLNPLINIIFNCPNTESSLIRNLYDEISQLDYWLLLVPPIHHLLNYQLSGKKLADWCHDLNFLKNHIVIKRLNSINSKKKGKINESDNKLSFKDNQIFQNLNGFNIYINSKNNCFTLDGNGLKIGKINIIDSNWLHNLNSKIDNSNDWGNKKILLLFIDKPICISDSFESLQRTKTLNNFDLNTSLSNSYKLTTNKSLKLNKDAEQSDLITFENLINQNVIWKKRLTECFHDFNTLINKKKFNQLNNNHDNSNKNKIIILNFKQIINQLNTELSKDRDFQNLPDINTLIYQYVESKLYNDIWNHISQNQVNENNNNSDHSPYIDNLSFDQLDTDFYNLNFDKFDLYHITQLEQNCENAYNILINLSLATNYNAKAKILIDTLQVLTKNLQRDRYNNNRNNQIIINADTLMNLFILVINRLNLTNLKYHLFYLQNFNIDEDNIKFGLLGYAISTLEAAIYYMEDRKKNYHLIKENIDNDKNLDFFLNYINSMDNTEMNKPSIDMNNFLRCLAFRNSKGQSIISQCIINFKNDLVETLLSKNLEKWFPLEDLLDDQDIDQSTLLLQSLKIGNFQIAMLLVNIILENCTQLEIKLYLNRLDKNNRHVGYYLMDRIELLNKIGKFLNWNNKDSTHQTPLFTIVRSYDQINYDLMVQNTLRIVKNWNETELGKQTLRLNRHEDLKGNTLLHILKSNIPIILNDPDIEININKCNQKNLTPLMVYVKYNRIDNVKAILNDERLSIYKTMNDPKKLTCFDYTKDKHVLNLLHNHVLLKYTIFGNILVHSLKFHQNMSYSIKLTVKITGRKNDIKYETINLNFNVIKKLIKLLVNKHPFFFVPLQEIMIKCHLLDESVSKIPKLCQLQYRDLFLRQLTNCLETLIEFDIIPKNIILTEEIKLLEWIQEEKIELQKTKTLNDEKLSNLNNNKKIKTVKPLLEPEEVNIIQNFLKFNIDELKKWKEKLTIFKRIIVFVQFKNQDVQISKSLIEDLIIGMNLDEVKVPNDETGNDISMDTKKEHVHELNEVFTKYTKIGNTAYGNESFTLLIENLEFLIICTDTLLGHMNQLLETKITNWWGEYRELLELKRRQNLFSVGNDRHNSFTSNSNINTILTNLLDSKKYKDEEKVNLEADNVRKNMVQINDNIMRMHETIAVTLSQFIEFRQKLLSHGIIKLWVQNNIISTKEQLINNRELQ